VAEAEALYRQALGVNPRHPDSLQNLGIIFVQSGQLPGAIEMLSRAIEVNPNASHYHANLGEALSRAGRHDESLASLRRAVALDPRNFNAYLNLALLLNTLRRMEETVAVCRQALSLNPNHATILKVLGDAYLLANRDEEAARIYEQLLRIEPAAHDGRFNMGHAYLKLGRLAEATACFRSVIAATPKDAQAHYQLGELLARLGLTADSIGPYEMAMRLDPRDELAPAGLASALKNLSQVDEAIAMYERALAINPQAAVTRANLANTLRDAGLIDQAIEHFRRALETAPDHAAIRSGLILTLYLHPEHCTQTVEVEKSQWNQRHAAPFAQKIQPHSHSRDPNRPLRIGYVSADLRNHPVSRFMLPILAHHDRAHFETYCYFNHQAADEITAVLRRHPKVWRDVAHLSDERLADVILDDRIDILIDLNMHTIGNRLTMFAMKPAPVQISYLAYTDGPGLSTIDYRLTDPYLEGAGKKDAGDWRGDAPLMLPETYWCYVMPTSPPGAPPLPNPSAGGRVHHVRFVELLFEGDPGSDPAVGQVNAAGSGFAAYSACTRRAVAGADARAVWQRRRGSGAVDAAAPRRPD
jgi:predicted O-linked N-acetylglucosamine transferase (SPINDLY family)